MITLEDIEKQVADSSIIRAAMNRTIKQLRDAETKVGTDILKTIILGQRRLTSEEYGKAGKRYGIKGLAAIEQMEHLTKYQKQYIFKQMRWDITEVK